MVEVDGLIQDVSYIVLVAAENLLFQVDNTTINHASITVTLSEHGIYRCWL